MATERTQHHDHEAILARIESAMASDPWDGRLAIIELVDGLMGDLPSERTVERVVEVLGRLAQDSKWEVRRAVVPVLVNAGRPGASAIITRLTGDDNQWVRQAAERAQRKLSRVTTTAEKQDKRARFAFDAIKDLDGTIGAANLPGSDPSRREVLRRVGRRHGSRAEHLPSFDGGAAPRTGGPDRGEQRSDAGGERNPSKDPRSLPLPESARDRLSRILERCRAPLPAPFPAADR